MKRVVALIGLWGLSQNAWADVFAVFRDEEGRTNWQYIANTSASLLILILLVVLVFLIRAHLRARRSNRALTEIKATLEERVAQRTQVLEETAEELRQREAYVSRVVNSMPVMLIGLNEELQVTQWNRTAEEATGRPFEDVKGENLWAAYPDIALSEDQVREVLRTGEARQLKHTQPDQHSFDITLSRLKGQDDIGIVILISDITKQVNAENKLAERDKLSALGELASAMAHDISLPINSILQRVSSSQQRIRAVEMGDEKQTLLQEAEMVRLNAEQATAIAQNLLDLARSHSHEKSAADIPALMDSSIELAGRLFVDAERMAFRDIEIRRHYASSLPQVACHPDELVQVFTRLLRSAFHALKQNRGDDAARIDIEIGLFVDSLWIKVAHRGRSLGPEEQLEIFEPYFLSDSSRDQYPIEHRLSYPHFIITEHHQGHMSVTSDERLGTCFNIQLPLEE